MLTVTAVSLTMISVSLAPDGGHADAVAGTDLAVYFQ
jgi:hypothetical protein